MEVLMIKEIRGDILETHCKIIAHGVNCQGVMGSGIAKALYGKWPQVRTEYMQYCKIEGIGDQNLGEIQFVEIESKKHVVNCFTQQNYGYDGQLYLSYSALKECLISLKADCKIYPNIKEIAMPKIGCGLAGGDWNIVKAIIESVFLSDFIINIYIK